jgi:hypothetical protein
MMCKRSKTHRGTVSLFRKQITLKFSLGPAKATARVFVFREWNSTLQIDGVQRSSFLLQLLDAYSEVVPKSRSQLLPLVS